MIAEDELRARLANDFSVALQRVGQSLTARGFDPRLAADSAMAAAFSATLDAIGPTALATHLREIADLLERAAGPPEFH